MHGFVDDIEERSEDSMDFRRVIYTGKHLQLVLMTLRPGEEIGEEVHPDTDQFFRVEHGWGEVTVDGRTTRVSGDAAILVPAGARHNVRNTGREPLRLSTLYAPPQHADGTVHASRVEAEASVEAFAGVTSE